MAVANGVYYGNEKWIHKTNQIHKRHVTGNERERDSIWVPWAQYALRNITRQMINKNINVKYKLPTQKVSLKLYTHSDSTFEARSKLMRLPKVYLRRLHNMRNSIVINVCLGRSTYIICSLFVCVCVCDKIRLPRHTVADAVGFAYIYCTWAIMQRYALHKMGILSRSVFALTMLLKLVFLCLFFSLPAYCIFIRLKVVRIMYSTCCPKKEEISNP